MTPPPDAPPAPSVKWVALVLVLLCLVGLGRTPTRLLSESPAPRDVGESLLFAVIGDYGWEGQAEQDVSTLVHGWNPDLILTTGDNNYSSGSAATIDPNIGQYYHDFIYPYTGIYGPGATSNRFFPALGNHDWDTPDARPYLHYFTLPGNERYYDFVAGPVHFFAIDSDSREPDGISSTSPQALWLQKGLATSTAPWKIVYLHHPPYSSSATHGSHPMLQWPYQAWGASALLSGHDHTYERLLVDGFPYFVNGLGGRSLYTFGVPVEGSVVRYNEDYGAMRVQATAAFLEFQFVSRGGVVIDTYTLNGPATPTATPTATHSPTATPTATPSPTPTATPTASATASPTPHRALYLPLVQR